MEILIELILELIVDGSIEASSNKTLPKWIRYPLIIFLILFFGFVYIVIFGTGILILKENMIAGILLIIIGMFLLISSIIKFKKVYINKKV
ncbi:MAG: hypothetical protein IJ565_00940 [Bacilli bacterium]|nr:hypothetical protein [Bacilli bacterium]